MSNNSKGTDKKAKQSRAATTSTTTSSPFQRGSTVRGSAIFRPDPNCKFFSVNQPTFQLLRTKGQLMADKTMFLHDLFYHESAHISLVFPRRMGKTLLLSMTECFFNIANSQKATPTSCAPFLRCVSGPGRRAAATDDDNYGLFAGTEIVKQKREFVSDHYRSYAVLFMSLVNVFASDYQGFLDKFREELAKVCEKDFRNIYDSYRAQGNELDIGDRRRMEFLGKARAGGAELNEAELSGSLHMLAAILREFYRRRVFILIDECDAPLNYFAKTNSTNEMDQERIETFHSGWIRSVKNMDFVNKVVTAGVMRTGSLHFSNVTFTECNLFREFELAKYFGFNELELAIFVEKMRSNGIPLADEDVKEAKKWYNGYAMQDYGTEHCFYNPFSMSQFLNKYADAAKKPLPAEYCALKATLQLYWSHDSGTLNYVHDLLKRKGIKEKISKLLDPATATDAEFTEFTPKSYFSLDDYRTLAEISNRDDSFNNEWEKQNFTKLFLTFLCQIGYLTIRPAGLVIPNVEIQICLKMELQKFFEQKYAFSEEHGNKVTRALKNVVKAEGMQTEDIDVEELRSAFEDLLSNMRTEVFTKAFEKGTDCESFRHGTLSYLCSRIYKVADLLHEYKFREVGSKQELKLDLSFNLDGTTVVVEMKHGNNGNATVACEEARYYRRKLFPAGGLAYILRFICLGIHVAEDRRVTIVHCVEDGKKEPEQMKTPTKFLLGKTHPKNQQ